MAFLLELMLWYPSTLGARNDEKTSDATHTSIWISLVAGVLLTVIGIVFSKPLLRLMSTP